MRCHLHHPLNTLLKTDEPAYLVAVAYKRKKNTNFKYLSDYTKRLLEKDLEKEEQTFGNLDSAFVPSTTDYEFASKSNLEKTIKKMEERMKTFSDSPENWRIVYTEIKGSTTDAKKDLFSQCGLTLVEDEYFTSLSREKLIKKVDDLVASAKEQSFIHEIYLTGSLARGASSSKDADVIIVTSHCPGHCEIFQNFAKTSLDLYCFNRSEFKLLEEEKYRIAHGKKVLFQR
ncbi:MAG: hypothetical protein GTN36_05135 [Candidatus Aenigmarchaeota archaeon]|nr:hypothetical protein [Candidatus Aenigmarchaeota archaeon]